MHIQLVFNQPSILELLWVRPGLKHESLGQYTLTVTQQTASKHSKTLKALNLTRENHSLSSSFLDQLTDSTPWATEKEPTHFCLSTFTRQCSNVNQERWVKFTLSFIHKSNVDFDKVIYKTSWFLFHGPWCIMVTKAPCQASSPMSAMAQLILAIPINVEPHFQLLKHCFHCDTHSNNICTFQQRHLFTNTKRRQLEENFLQSRSNRPH